MVFTARFISIRKHAKRGMVAIGFYHSFALVINVLINRRTITNRSAPVGPGRTFHLQVKTRSVGSIKSGFGRAPGMETHMVQTIRPGYPENAHPGSGVRCRITGQRKNSTLQCTAKKCTLSVDGELGTLGRKVPHAKR